MNKTQFFALLLLSLGSASHLFTVDVDRSGLSSATLSLEGGDTVNVSLPEDAYNFRMVGGSYSIANRTATVVSGATGFATFSFSTSLFTTKTDSVWTLSFSAPDGGSVRVYAPPYAAIENSLPQPRMVSSEDSRLILEIGGSDRITVRYRLDEPPQTNEQSDLSIVLFAVAALLLVLIFMQRSKLLSFAQSAQAKTPAGRAPSLEPTPGKREMLQTFNENDLRIVSFLTGNQGRSRRNELERKTGISKSSLAMALNRLEKRKIIELDRTSTTHFVKLSDFFLRL